MQLVSGRMAFHVLHKVLQASRQVTCGQPLCLPMAAEGSTACLLLMVLSCVMAADSWHLHDYHCVLDALLMMSQHFLLGPLAQILWD